MSYNYRLYQWKIDCVNRINHDMISRQNRVVAVVAATVAMCASEVEEKRAYKNKRCWMAAIHHQRRRNGFYYCVFPILKLDDLRFKNYFRMNYTQFEELLRLVAPTISRQHVVREPIEAEQRLIICLRYLASGDSMTSMAYQYSVSLTAVCQIIPETCEAIWDILHRLVLPSRSENDWKKIANRMNTKWQFPHCIGAMDGKHVVIQCPEHSGSAYFNYKKQHSIVLLAICDADYLFTHVDIGAYGRQSDGGVFKNSLMGQRFAQGQMSVPPAEEIYDGSSKYPYVLVGDEAFPLSPFLMRPFPGKDGLSTKKKIFNYRLSRARRTIENTFGILAAQWRIYRKPILAKVETVEKMVKATVCLHNWLRKKDVPNKEMFITRDMTDEEASDGTIIRGSWRENVDLEHSAFTPIAASSTHSYSRLSAAIREQFMEYFDDEGAVPWQFLRIHN